MEALADPQRVGAAVLECEVDGSFEQMPCMALIERDGWIVARNAMGRRLTGFADASAVRVSDALLGGIRWRETPVYVAAQGAGAIAGVVLAHAMFGLPALSASTHARSGWAQMLSEFVATFGLLAVIWGCGRSRPTAVPFAVGAYIMAAYWFTASTSFANPAVTLARSMTNTFSGIRPADVGGFVAAQMAGALAATALFRWLIPSVAVEASAVLVRHE